MLQNLLQNSTHTTSGWRLIALMIIISFSCFTLGCASTSARQSSTYPPAALRQTSQTLEPGQRFEAIIVEPAGKFKKRRVRGVITPDHRLMLPELGSFDTRNKTRAQLEQDMLASFNQGNDLRGTVRLSIVNLPTTGLFILAPQKTLQQILSDPLQKQLLDEDNHPLWQWIILDDTFGHQTITTIHQSSDQAIHQHDGKAAVVAQPANAILVGQSLQNHVLDAHVSLNPINQHKNLAVQLAPAAGTALTTLSQSQPDKPLLIVSQGRCIYAAILSPYMGQIMVINSGSKSFSDEQIRQLKAVFVQK